LEILLHYEGFMTLWK